MNRRDFMKTVGASGMAFVAPMTLSGKAVANDLVPVGKYFVFVHLGGGWEPTTFCNPKGNVLRSSIDPNSRNSGSPVNRYPASAIRKAADVYSGTASISDDMEYAPYLGTYNFDGPSGEIDDLEANEGITTQHVQQILSGTLSGNTITAQLTTGFEWDATAKSAAAVNAKAILEGDVTTIQLNGIQSELVDRDLEADLAAGTMAANLFVYDAFVCLYAEQLRVLNGVDNRTNSHSTGTMYADTGSMAMGYPDFSALYAAVHGPDRPLAWMTDGSGNDEAAALVARSESSNATFFQIVGDPTNGMTAEFSKYLDNAQERRKVMQAQKENLPLRRQYQDQLYLVREQGVEFAGVAGEIVTPEPGTPAAEVAAASNSNRRNHMRIGAAGFASGMASSMQVGFGGFDTHGNHDNNHFPRIRTVLVDLHFLFRALEAYNVDTQTTVIVGSDFGRTPWYNDGNGKDHWAVTSYMFMGNGVTGGTQVNATNGLVEAKEVDANLNVLAENQSGYRMTAAHVHRKLRDFAGIQNNPLALEFPIEADDLPILG
jgi:uncharacterized protein (DUF1501 family)